MMRFPRHNPVRPARGFTLLEVILGVTVTAVVSAALFTSMSGTFRARAQAENHLSGRSASLSVAALVRADLMCVPPAGGRIGGVFIGEDGSGMNAWENDTLTYITANPAIQSDQDLADLRQVELRLLESSEDPDHYVLARLVTGNLLAVQTPEPALQVLARRVVSLSLRYYDGGAWLDEWDSTERDNLIPTGVELILVIAPELNREFADDGEREASYITTRQVVRLPAAVEVDALGGILDGVGF